MVAEVRWVRTGHVNHLAPGKRTLVQWANTWREVGLATVYGGRGNLKGIWAVTVACVGKLQACCVSPETLMQ